jgi:LacI family transcriptional regulator
MDNDSRQTTFPNEGGQAPVRKLSKVTMKEVAALAGASLSTVSRVVNQDLSVRADLRERVQRAVDTLGYRPNFAASALRRADGVSSSIGLIVEDVANPFFSSMQRGIENVARQRAVLTFTGSTDEDAGRERQLADTFGARGVDGLIIAPASSNHSYLLRERDAGTAVVFVDRPGQFIDADAVLSDNAAGASSGVSHLIAAGHRRIAFLGDRGTIFTIRERLRGYRETLIRHGLPEATELIIHTARRATDVYEVTRELMLGPNAPTAIFSAQNLVTIEATRALHDAKLQHRVALVGFDDVPMADIVDPGITVVAQDANGLGVAAAELLFSRLDGSNEPTRQVVLPTKLIPRGSGEIPPPTS